MNWAAVTRPLYAIYLFKRFVLVYTATIRNVFGNLLKRSLRTEVATLPGGVLPYMGYIGMCRCEGYGFQEVYSRIGYINQSVWV